MRQSIEGSCVFSHCQVDNFVSVSQYLSSPGRAYAWYGVWINVVSEYGDLSLLVLCTAFQGDVVHGDDLISNFDSSILHQISEWDTISIRVQYYY